MLQPLPWQQGPPGSWGLPQHLQPAAVAVLPQSPSPQQQRVVAGDSRRQVVSMFACDTTVAMLHVPEGMIDATLLENEVLELAF